MDENEIVIDETLEDLDENEESEEETDETPKQTEKPKETPEAKKARLERELKSINKKLGVKEPKESARPEPKTQNTDGLDDTQLDYLDLKGISDEDDIDLIQTVMRNTGQSLRETLKDEYVASKLEANKQARAVKDATPSSTKRSGNQQSEASSIISKFEATGVMPEDFASREVIVDYLVKKDRSNAPSWHK